MDVNTENEVKAIEEEKMEDDNEPFQFDPTLFPVLSDDELEKLIAEWKCYKPLWDSLVPSLHPFSISSDEEML